MPRVRIAYSTYGTLSQNKDNVVWVCHALTANSQVDQWWPNTVESNKFLDPQRYFIVCANILGSHYGTTGPLDINPETGQPWYDEFPLITVRDMVKCHKILAEHLGIDKVKLLIGSSIGGFQCLEMCVSYPSFAENAVLIATSAKATPWVIALNESQRMAIETDSTFYNKTPDGGKAGMRTARSMALLSYRGPQAYNKTQADDDAGMISGHRVCSYQRYQGKKLSERFNAYSYYRLTQAIDSHDIGRGRGGIEKALSGIKTNCCVIAIDSDILFPVADHDVLRQYIPSCSYYELNSDFAHDGFLVEHEKLDTIIKKFVNNE